MINCSQVEVEKAVKELCSEDDWGSWELWWYVSEGVPNEETAKLKRTFIKAISEMVECGDLIAKCHGDRGDCSAVLFDSEKLLSEIESSRNPEPNSFFWFGTR